MTIVVDAGAEEGIFENVYIKNVQLEVINGTSGHSYVKIRVIFLCALAGDEEEQEQEEVASTSSSKIYSIILLFSFIVDREKKR